MRVSVRGFFRFVFVASIFVVVVVRSERLCEIETGMCIHNRGWMCALFRQWTRRRWDGKDPCWELRGFDNLFGVWGVCEDEVWVW